MQPFKKILMIVLCGSFIAFSVPLKGEYDSYDISTILNWNLKTVLSTVVGTGICAYLLYAIFGKPKLNERRDFVENYLKKNSAVMPATLRHNRLSRWVTDGHAFHSIALGKLSFAEYLDQTVKAGSVHIHNGKQAKLLGDKIIITQLKVADQCTVCKECGPIGGGNDSCGYHAVKNSIYVWRALNCRELPTDAAQLISSNLNDYGIVQELFDLHKRSVWRSALKLITGQKGWDGEFIHSGQIERIIGAEQQEGLLVGENFNFSVIDRIDDLKQYEQLQKTFGQPNYRHVFILGTMGSVSSEHRSGHWFTVIVNKKDDVIEYIIMDSKNIIRLYDPIIKQLMQWIQPVNKEKIEKEFNQLRTTTSEEFAKKYNLNALQLGTEAQRNAASKLSQRFAQLGGDPAALDQRIAQAAAQ